MTQAVRDNFKLVLYAVALAGLIGFGTTAYRGYPRGDSPAPTPPAPVGTNLVADTNAVPAPTPADPPEPAAPPRRELGKVFTYGSLAFLSLIGLGLLVARDIARYVAHRVDDFIFNDDLRGVHNPEYEEAERVWANGRHLDAIQLMRDYLKKHPMEQYVALRIAEIYETDLGNYLAAALEYEEVLNKRLPPERWGWAAIHLANLYSGRLNRIQEASDLLHRIVNEYGQTAAAKKARERLGIPEPVAPPPPEPKPEKPAPPPPPPSNLPPGFRPKS